MNTFIIPNPGYIHPETGCWFLREEHRNSPFYRKYRGGEIHRIMYAAIHGELPRGREFHVHHTCGQKGCYCPEHLRGMPNSEHARLHMAQIDDAYRQKMSDSTSRYWSNPQARQQQSERLRGRTRSTETRQRMREAQLGQKRPEWMRQRMSEAKRRRGRFTSRGVQVVREMRTSGMTQQAIADYLGVTRGNVRSILNIKVYEVCA